MGHYTAIALHEEGHDVTVFTRGRHAIELPDGIEHLQGDRENEADLQRAAADGWDVVWDNMSYTAEHARAAVRIFSGACDLFLHTSTLAVYSVCEGIVSPYWEEDFARGRPLVERRGTYPYDYGIDRREGEEVLQRAYAEHGFPFVALRLPDGGMDMQRPVYSGDVVDAIRAIIDHGPELAGRAYNLGSREIFSLRYFVERSAQILEREVEILDIPRTALALTGFQIEPLSPYSTWGNHLHSIARAQHDFEFNPTPMEEWLAPTIEWHLENRRDAEPPGWDLKEDERILGQQWRSFLRKLG